MAQFCGQLGGAPNSAYPVCGNITLAEKSWPPCSGTNEIFVPGCTGKGNFYYDKNPTWYKFTCYQTGTFGFEVTPNIPTDDFDWQIFDITGHPPNIVYNKTLAVVVASNWANTAGGTGANSSGPGQTQCRSDIPDSRNSYAFWPTLQAGHNYMLLLSHAQGSGNYTIAFGTNGSTADITDPVLPHMISASTPCGGSPLSVKFNRSIRCTSFSGIDAIRLNSDGSEFSISPPLANVIAAKRMTCVNTFETDTIVLTLDNTLPPGNYEVLIQNGNDGNSVSDFCDRFVQVGERVPFVVPVVLTPHMDSIVQPACRPKELILFFKKPILVSSVSSNGSQFSVTGTAPVTIVHAQTTDGTPGADGTFHHLRLTLSAPITIKGNFQIKNKTGDDGKQLIDQCNLLIANGETLNFQTKDTVNAIFDYAVRLGCVYDTIDFSHDGNNEVNSWLWSFEDGRTSLLQKPRIIYSLFGLKHAQLIVSNGACLDTASADILLDNELKAGFESTSMVCPGQVVSFRDTSIGHVLSRLWTFGNGNTSTLKTPPSQQYPIPRVPTDITVSLELRNSLGCTGTATKKLTLADICYVYVPGAFTPNNDGLNDYLYPLNVFNSTGFKFKVYNRYGQVMFESAGPLTRWNGKFKGQVADPGVYVWTLQYIDNNSGNTIIQRGSTILIR